MFDFPNAPVVGQSANGYVYDGQKWDMPAGASVPMFGTGAFAVNRNDVNQTGMTAALANKITWTNEVRDQNGWFDPATGRYTPQVAGLYFFVLATASNMGTSSESNQAVLMKNGVTAILGAYINIGSSSTVWTSQAIGCLYMNGTTDYVDAWVYLPSATTSLQGATRLTHFEGWRVEDPTIAPIVSLAPKKNYIVNGAMQISQEWGTTPGAGSFYPVDEFRGSNSSGGVLGAAQVVVATPGGSTHRVRFTCNTADVAVAAADFVGITHTIEGLRCADLLMGTASAKTFTLRFGVKAPAGTYGVLFRNAANNRHYVAECVIAAGEANTDVVKSITVPGDIIGTWAKDNTIGLMIWWVLMSGTDYHGAAGAWVGSALPYTTASQVNFMASNTNVFELFDVGLYEGTTAPTFVVPDYATELSLCQRYYERSVEHGGGYGALTGTRTIPYSGTNSVDSCSFMTNKRAAPAIQTYSPITGVIGKVYHNGVGDVNATVDAISTMSFRIYPTVAVSTNCYYHFTASARQ